jgi:hypothetical protein
MAGNTKGRRRRFGAIRQLPSGRYQVRYPGPDGLLHPADQTFPTQTDAEVWLSVIEADMVRGTWFDPDVGRVPLGEYAERWIAERPGLSPRTVTLYGGLLRLHVKPALGRYDLVDLTPPRIRAWRKELLDGGLGDVTVAKCYRFLRAVLNTAVDDELIRRNPCRIKGAGSEARPGAPRGEPRPGAGPDCGDAGAVAGARAPGGVVQLAVGRADGAQAGRRRSAESDRAGPAIVERRQGPDGARATEVGGRKRTVAIPDPVVPMLWDHLRRFSESGSAGRVFVGTKGATLRRTNFQAMWVKALEKAGLPAGFRFHDLRHTGNTWAADSGANLRELMERMGHSSTRAALFYLHGSRNGDRRIADGIGRQMAAGAGAV